MSPKPIEPAKNPLLVGAFPALRRARRRAEEVAIASSTAGVMVVEGKIVFVHPKGRRADGDPADGPE